MSEDDSSTLIILLETTTHLWSLVSRSPPKHLQERAAADILIEQLLTFVRAFLLVSDGNKVAIFAVHEHSSPLLYASPALLAGSRTVAHSNSLPSAEIKARLGSLVQAQGPRWEGPALAGALSRVLCLLHRAGSSARPGPSRKARLLCVQASPDISAQYIAFMNAVFSAQRNDAVIDACMVGGQDSSLLQQACHLTGGIYTKIVQLSGLLQYLMAVYAGDAGTRSLLVLPQTHEVDFRASCFCHKRAIDLGYVCSVCLSIFCESLDECSTCGTVFPPSDAGAKRSAAAFEAGGNHNG